MDREFFLRFKQCSITHRSFSQPHATRVYCIQVTVLHKNSIGGKYIISQQFDKRCYHLDQHSCYNTVGKLGLAFNLFFLH